MKHLSIILSVYLLALAIIPCVDGVVMEAGHDETHVHVEFDGSDGHNHEHDGDDDCSPLCACSCCNITLSPPGKIITLRFSSEISMELPNSYTELLSLVDIKDIWEPPKLG